MNRFALLTLAAVLPPGLLPVSCAPRVTSFPTVSVSALNSAVRSGAYVLDVRTPAEYAEGHIAGALNLPLDTLHARAAEVPADRPVYVICRSGARSAQASALLKEAGRDPRNVGGGMNDWVAAGFPVRR